MTTTQYEFIALLEKAAADEATAREKYFELLAKLPEEDHHIINEIIADELNHSILLSELVFKYSRIAPKED